MRLASLFIVLLLIIPLASAVNIELKKDPYQPGETLQAAISGDFVNTLSKSDVSLLRGDTEISAQSDLIFLNTSYFFYAMLPQTEGNYTLKIANKAYMENGILKEGSFEKTFLISMQNATRISVKPGFVIATNNLEVSITNLGSGYANLTAEFEATNDKVSITLPPGELWKPYFQLNNFAGASNIKISSSGNLLYNIPVQVFGAQTVNISNNNSQIISTDLKFFPAFINVTLLKGDKISSVFELISLSKENLTGISLSSSSGLKDIINITPQKLDLEPSQKAYVTIIIDANKKGNFTGLVSAVFENASATISVDVIVTENSSVISNLSTFGNPQNCTSLRGKICNSSQTCNYPAIITYGGIACCLGKCIDKQAPASTGGSKIIPAILIIVAIAAVVFFVWKKYSKSGKTSQQIMNEIEQKYKKQPAQPQKPAPAAPAKPQKK